MLISHIVPTDLLSLIEGRDFYMCLANIASKNDEYAEFYRKQRERGAFVLLDNGAAEKDQMDLDTMWETIEKVNPNEVILNDSLLDAKETVKKSKEALKFYKSKGFKGQYMFVPQGRDFNEWHWCFNHMSIVDIKTFGVSKFLTSGWNDSNARRRCCEFFNRGNMILHKVHLLGCHENIGEVKDLSRYYFVRSNDTAIAYIYALDSKSIEDGDRPSGEIDFIKSQLDKKQIETLKQNIKIFDEKVK